MQSLLHSIKQQIIKAVSSSNSGSNNNAKELFVICVDGNIGAGKTTFCNQLINYLTFNNFKNICYITENVDNNELFNNYLKNQKEYGLQFQKWILNNKIEQYQQFINNNNLNNNPKIVIFDRSLFADKFVFVNNLNQLNILTNEELNNYNLEFNKYLKNLPKELFFPNLYIYLNVNIPTILERIKSRNRSIESTTYSIEYLTNIENYHINLLNYLQQEIPTNIHYFNNY
ncbi:hypothetical protein ABK040_000285 [Willaertia magna]